MLRRQVSGCVEIKFTARSSRIAASTSTPSTRHLLDGVAVPVPHRSTESARPSASHAATAAAAADLRRFRPSIRIHGLVARLANEHDQNERLASLFRDRCGDARLHWYEDVVDRPDLWATIMYQLGLWPAPDASRLRGMSLKNTTHVVHGALPVRSLISNYDKVARALRPTKFKWMLE